MKLVIIDYGAGNIQSIQFAFKRLGLDAILTNSIGEIESADKIIFPGVGEASSAMKMLRECGLDKIIPKLKQPVIGICLGMQLMCGAIIFMLTASIVAINFITDIILALADPRIRRSILG